MFDLQIIFLIQTKKNNRNKLSVELGTKKKSLDILFNNQVLTKREIFLLRFFFKKHF